MVIADISLVTAVFICIEIRIHVSATSPVLVSNAKEIQFPWFLMTIFLTKVSHRGNALKSDILYPFGHFLYGSASQISIYISLASKLLAKFKEFMSTKTVIFYHTAPMCINHFFTCLFRSDTIFPVVFICEASTRPAKHRDFDMFQGFYYICTHSVLIWNRRILTYIDSFIDTSSKMFREMSVNLFVDFALFF